MALKLSSVVYIRVIITCLYVLGIAGNIAGLVIISKNDSKYKKQALMLNCLVWNDLIALLGSFIMMQIGLYMPTADMKLLCAFRVIWRIFGLGSGCISVVMAIERWLALTHPFIYQKHVTLQIIRRSIITLWVINVALVFAPFAGFGLWFDESREDGPCVRYRFGRSPADSAYVFVVFTFGMCMCICIVCCNMAVARVLCSKENRTLSKRDSRIFHRKGPNGADITFPRHTRAELAFARLMAILSIFFVVCWCPQLMTILSAQLSVHTTRNVYDKVADILIALNFVFNPFLYVLLRQKRKTEVHNAKVFSLFRHNTKTSSSRISQKTLCSTKSVQEIGDIYGNAK